MSAPLSKLPALWCAILLASCSSQEQGNASSNAAPAEQNAASPAPVTPVAVPPLGREELLLAVMRAASAAAAGTVDRANQRELDGKRFSVAIRFGCGAEQGTAPFGWRVEEKDRTLRVSAAPNLAADDPLVADLLQRGEYEDLEGFWLPRPWLLTDACPPASPPPADLERPAAKREAPKGEEQPAPPASLQRIGIARLFTSTDTRSGRRSGRPYQAVVQLTGNQAAPDQGLNLVLQGRLRALPDGRVVACAAATADRPPDCIVAADFDQVSIQRPGTGEVLAQWSQ